MESMWNLWGRVKYRWLWAVIMVGGFIVMDTCCCLAVCSSWWWVVVGIHVFGWLVFVAVGGCHCVLIWVRGSCCCLLCAHPVSCSGCGLLWVIAIHVHVWSLVVSMGGSPHLWLLCVGSCYCRLCCVIVVVVWRRAATSHVVTTASCLYSHMRSCVCLMCI